MASRYPPQIFWVLAVALAYTLLAFAEGEETNQKKGTIALFMVSLTRQDHTGGHGSLQRGPSHTHDALDRVGS